MISIGGTISLSEDGSKRLHYALLSVWHCSKCGFDFETLGMGCIKIKCVVCGEILSRTDPSTYPEGFCFKIKPEEVRRLFPGVDKWDPITIEPNKYMLIGKKVAEKLAWCVTH